VVYHDTANGWIVQFAQLVMFFLVSQKHAVLPCTMICVRRGSISAYLSNEATHISAVDLLDVYDPPSCGYLYDIDDGPSVENQSS